MVYHLCMGNIRIVLSHGLVIPMIVMPEKEMEKMIISSWSYHITDIYCI